MSDLAASSDSNQNQNTPLYAKRYGNIDLSIWRNVVKKMAFYTVRLSRNYKAKTGSWQTSSLNLDAKDLGNAIALLKRAEAFILSEDS
mgnify:CR=1 FL=1